MAISLVFGAITLVLWSGAHDVVDGRLTVGTLSQFVLYAVLGGGSVGALAETWNELQKAAGGMGRIGELLDERSGRSEEHTSELQSLMRNSYAVFCFKKK